MPPSRRRGRVMTPRLRPPPTPAPRPPAAVRSAPKPLATLPGGLDGATPGVDAGGYPWVYGAVLNADDLNRAIEGSPDLSPPARIAAFKRWVDTTALPYARQCYADGGSTPVYTGSFDTANHLWLPLLGGGIGSLAVGSDGVADLGTVAENLIEISGTHLAELGSSLQAGAFKLLRFAGATTLVASSLLTLLGTPSGGVTAAGDVALAIAFGDGAGALLYMAQAVTDPIADAPADGTPYARQDHGWAPAVEEAPSDGAQYGRQAGAWTPSLLPALPRANRAMGFDGGGLAIAGGSFPNLVNLSQAPPAGIATIPYWACGMDPGLADNSAALAAGLTNFNGVIDGGYQTFRFTRGGGTDTAHGPLLLGNLSGVRGLRNMTLDFSACIADRYCLYLYGYPPGPAAQPLVADLQASSDPTLAMLFSTTGFSVGQPVILRSDAVWLPNGLGVLSGPLTPWHLTEFNRVIAVSPSQLTLEAPTANDFLVSDNAYIAPFNGTPAGAWAPFTFHLDRVTIIGAGSARTADVQFGLRLLYAQGSQLNGTFKNCWDTSLTAQVCIDTKVDYVKASDSGGLGRGYTFVSAGSWRTNVVQAVGENCNQAADVSGTQLSFATATSRFELIEEEDWGRAPRSGTIGFDMIDRNAHFGTVISSGDYHSGAAFNSHPPAAQTWIDVIIGKSKLAGSDGQFVYFGGYQQGVGRIIAPYTAGHTCYFGYAGGRDKNGAAWFRAGSIDVGACGIDGYALLVTTVALDASRPLDWVEVGSITMGTDCKRGLSISSTYGPIGAVNIGASLIRAADTGFGGIELTCASGGYSLGRLRLNDSFVGTASLTKSPIWVSTSGVTTPEINITNCTLSGGNYGLIGSSAKFLLTGQVKVLAPHSAPYSMDANSFVEIFGGSPADRWAPTGSGTFQLKASKTEVLPSAGGSTHTFFLPVGYYSGQEFVVAMLANGDSAVWTPASGQSINGMPATLSPYSSARARFDGVSTWNRVG